MPKCYIHGCEETKNLYPICRRGTEFYDEDDEDVLINKYICEKHLKESEFRNTYEDGGYARCCLCPDVAYNIRDLVNIGGAWYCKEHSQEAPSDMDLDDYESLGDQDD